MRWLRRLRPSRPASSHRSGGRRLGGGAAELEAGGMGWPEGWGCSGQRALRRRWCVLGRLGRAHRPPGLGWAGGGARPPAGPDSELEAEGRGRRKSSRDVRVPGKWVGGAGPRKAKRQLIGARASFTATQWVTGARTSGVRTRRWLQSRRHSFRPGDPPTTQRLGSSCWSRGCCRGPAAAGGSGERR